jgi:apolipoprotein D and lipocalin family protein
MRLIVLIACKTGFSIAKILLRLQRFRNRVSIFNIYNWKLMKTKYLRNVLIICIAGTIFLDSCKSQNPSPMINNSTVKHLDLNRYLGVWYEAGRFPTRFEKNMVAVTATYSLRPDGKIKVVNQGRLGSLDGKLKIADGKAKIPDMKDPGKLKVSFFLFFYADYYVMELDEVNYQWALVGSSSPDYLWILSRTPHLPEELYSMIVGKAAARGYDTHKIIKVEQP